MKVTRSAVWRLALPGILVFAAGSAVALLIAYQATVRALDDQFNALLTSEAADLSGEADGMPEADLAQWLATEREDLLRYLELQQSLPRTGDAPVVLVITDGGRPVAWAGTGDPDWVLRALAGGAPRSTRPINLRAGVDGPSLRAAQWSEGGRGAVIALTPPPQTALLGRISTTLTILWAAVLVIGGMLSLWSVGRVLRSVDHITDVAASITDPEEGRRIPEPGRGDEIGRLASTLNRMLERIAAGTREIRDLSQAVAHDLRSPVTVIRGRLEMALSDPSEVALEDAAARAIEGLDRLGAILEAELDVAEAEGGALRPQLEALDLARLCRELTDLYEAAAAEQGLTLSAELSGDLVVDGDPHLLGRALSNLLDNALRHAEGARHLRLSATRDTDGVRLQVEDDGPGFPPLLRDRAFERSARRPGTKGLGLGLLQVRAAARAHGGEARLVAGTLGGAAVQIFLPF